MTLNPDLKAFVAAGLYDSLNSCAANEGVPFWPGQDGRA
jgi:hypothetical protein